jgi:oligoribonuclease
MRHDWLVWLDMEMSGLDPARERILEIATLVTDGELSLVAEGPELVLFQPDSVLLAMDEWNTAQHGRSGLVERVRASTVTVERAEDETLAFLERHCRAGAVPLAGSSVGHDRRFLRRYMPRLDAFFHYRIVDVSTIKELARRWYPDVVLRAPAKREGHRALDDIRESLDELRFYRASVFR